MPWVYLRFLPRRNVNRVVLGGEMFELGIFCFISTKFNLFKPMTDFLPFYFTRFSASRLSQLRSEN